MRRFFSGWPVASNHKRTFISYPNHTVAMKGPLLPSLPVVLSLERERVNGKEGAPLGDRRQRLPSVERDEGIAPSIRNEGGKEGRKNPAEKEERGPLSFHSPLFSPRVCLSVDRPENHSANCKGESDSDRVGRTGPTRPRRREYNCLSKIEATTQQLF